MSSPQESGSTSPSDEGQLENPVTAFTDAVFEATQGLLSAQQQLTHTLLGGQEGQTEADVDQETPRSGYEQETDPVAADQADQVDTDADQADQVDTDADQADQLDTDADQADEADELDDEADDTDAAPAPAGERRDADRGRGPSRRLPLERRLAPARSGRDGSADRPRLARLVRGQPDSHRPRSWPPAPGSAPDRSSAVMPARTPAR